MQSEKYDITLFGEPWTIIIPHSWILGDVMAKGLYHAAIESNHHLHGTESDGIIKTKYYVVRHGQASQLNYSVDIQKNIYYDYGQNNPKNKSEVEGLALPTFPASEEATIALLNGFSSNNDRSRETGKILSSWLCELAAGPNVKHNIPAFLLTDPDLPGIQPLVFTVGVDADVATVTIHDTDGGVEASIDGGAFASDLEFTGLSSGDHTITVRDVNGQPQSQVITVI